MLIETTAAVHRRWGTRLGFSNCGGLCRSGGWRATPDDDEHYVYAIAL
jgi:hypothetical protein